MGTQIIFVVETNAKCKSDWIYIKETIDSFFEYDRAHMKFTPIYMNGKGNYKSKTVDSKIKNAVSQYAGESYVIYCFDCDEYDVKQEDKEFLKTAQEFCSSNEYDFIWFNKDIEHVYHGVQVDKNLKEKYSYKFKADKMINCIDINRLKNEELRVGYSNLVIIIEKYMKLRVDVNKT